jgi:xylan 1,4-beta-xylosidase
VAAAFDDALVEAVGTAIGTEARAFANAGRAHLDFWTPNVNPFRDPRWGRGHETPGEDALRCARFAGAFVRGMQGNASTLRVVATCKHFAAYDLEAAGGGTTRFNFNAKVSTQELAEYYLPPFRECARDARAGSVMCSYNAVNGVPACANSYLLDTVLRKHWGWEGDNQYVVTDCDAAYYLGSASGGHRYKGSYAAAVGAAFEAGADNLCWATGGTQPDPAGAFASGRGFSQATLDRMLLRQMQGLVRAGYFDGSGGAYRQLGAADVNAPAHRRLALRAAEQGIVLLKNDGALPLTEKGSLVFAGFWANKADVMLGGYSGTPPFKADPLTAAKAAGWSVTLAPDSGSVPAAAASAKAIVYFGGIDNSVEEESKDRTGISWPASQVSAIQKLAGQGKPVIVVRMGSHVDDTPVLNIPNVKAILWAGYPGQDGGTAVMNIISGATAPSGRLPITVYPTSYTSQAPYTNMALRPSGSYPGRTYQWYDKAVFPFGHGLHYTNFTITPGTFPSSLSIQELLAPCQEKHPDLCRFPALPVTVNNTGGKASDFVVLAFLTGAHGPTPRPLKRLAAYSRVSSVEAGQSRAAALTWNLGNIARVDTSGNTVLYPGTYEVLLDQPTAAKVSFTLTGEEAVLDKWPQPP